MLTTGLAVLLVAGSGVGPVWAAKPAAPPKTPVLTEADAKTVAEQQVTVAKLRRILTFISSDALQGRDTPSPGLDAAAQFLAFNLSRLGLVPKGDNGTYFQKFALTEFRPDGDNSRATLTDVTGTATPLRFGDDFLPGMKRWRGVAGTVADAPLVYVSHGWQIPAAHIDAYQGIDVRGKILVVNGFAFPAAIDNPQILHSEGALNARAYGAAHGALGVVYLPIDGPPEMDLFPRYEDFLASVRAGTSCTVRPADDEAPPPPKSPATPAAAPDDLPSIVLSPDAARRLFAGEPLSGEELLRVSTRGQDHASFDLNGQKRLSFTAAYRIATRWTQNVVAAWPGGDCKDQYIAIGAHYDHLGLADEPDARGDRIYNGADDDGSGTTSVLALAEAFASHPEKRPRRSILFVWHCGEEKGLWGSDHFTSHPTVPLKQVAADLNIDMIGRSKPKGDTDPRDATLTGPNSIYVIGSRTMSGTLGDVSERVNKGYLNLHFDYKYDAPNDSERLFYRSDHFNYARRGVPILFYFDGVHRDYHQVTDEIDEIDFLKMEKVARTIFVTATALADLPNPPKVDRKLPFRVE